ncbi:hypothetical protein ARMGADRAFT_1083019 [Armillaria gallica]|uniref:Uncharacterized protein n=1 Tax=Armillaria gallica TaxID=47427 RepID=A0A2H3D7Q0_ARMGA|nr:hypothetical protein ARMGADRAFT_1083019 [Armillaria gallica]
MYRPRFIHDPHTNILYTDCEAVNAAQLIAEGMDVPPPPNVRNRLNPRGFPMNVKEVHDSVTFIHMCKMGWQAVLCLLWEFHRISSSVIMRYQDLSMHKIMEVFEWDNCLSSLAHGLVCPYFILLDARFQSDGVANGTGLSMPVNGTLDDWCQYTAHHFHPSGLNPTSSITMDTSYQVSYVNVWGMLQLQFLHPTSAKKFYARYFVGIVFRL